MSGLPEIRPVPGFPGYFVGEDGSVWSQWKRGVRPIVLASSITRLKTATLDDGHLAVTLSRDGKPRSHKVHRLVMLAFVGPCPEGLEVCHNNGNPADNRLSELRYDTHSNNMLDAVRHGTLVNNRGEQSGQAKLTNEQVAEICELLSQKVLFQYQIAEKFNVSQSTINRISNGKNWNHKTARATIHLAGEQK